MTKKEELLYTAALEYIVEQPCRKLENGCYSYVCSYGGFQEELKLKTVDVDAFVSEILNFLTNTQLSAENGNHRAYCVLGTWRNQKELTFQVFVPNERYLPSFIPYMVQQLKHWRNVIG